MNSKYAEISNIYLQSRLSTEPVIKREEASTMLHIDYETLGKYERGQLTPPDEMVISMSRLYNDPILPLEHLFEKNLIGRSFGWKVERTDISKCTLNFLSRLNDVAASKDNLLHILDDGEVTEPEKPELNRIMDLSDRFVQKAVMLRFLAGSFPGELAKTKEKTAVSAAVCG